MDIQQVVYLFIASFVALFPVMNPIGSGFIVNGFLEGLEEPERRTASRRIARNCLLVGVGSLVAGHLILLLFGLAVPVIQIGGGILICRTAWQWLSDAGTSNTERKEKSIMKIDISEVEGRLFYPISFPVSFGPGSISVIFTLMAATPVSGRIIPVMVNYAAISLAIITLCSILYLFLKQGDRIMKRLGPSVSQVVNKLIAFITFCIGLQIILNGIGKAFHISVL